jgi:drug/metabolite transporter (DMT)-like permease
MLFAYAAFFSYAYLTLSAGTGALILFGAVQLTMFSVGLHAGERFGFIAWLGLALAVAGLVYLVWPGVAAPPLFGAALMAIAGVAWGVYSLRGRGVADPLGATAGNFARATPFALLLNLIFLADTYADTAGIVLAIASGAITSGVGYVIWYAALRKLSAMRAATVQLSVPLIAAFGGVTFLSEAITPRLAAATVAILGGIALVLTSRSRIQSGRSSYSEKHSAFRRMRTFPIQQLAHTIFNRRNALRFGRKGSAPPRNSASLRFPPNRASQILQSGNICK